MCGACRRKARIMIDKRTYKLLKRLYRRERLTLAEVEKITGHGGRNQRSQCVEALTKAHYISCWHGDKIIDDLGDREWIGFEITLDGRAYIEQERRTRMNFWLPYTITTVIALMSLIASLAEHLPAILSLIKEHSLGS